MTPETLLQIRMFAAMSGADVDVVCCVACGAERALSSASVAENGLPQRCASCGARDITIRRFQCTKAGVTERPPHPST